MKVTHFGMRWRRHLLMVLPLLVVLALGVLARDASLVRADGTHPGLTPALVEETIAAGASAEIEKTVHTPAIPPDPEICFLADTTGSMGPAIDNVKANATVIMNAVQAVQPDAQFCAAQYRDAGDSPEYSLDQAMTSSTADVQTAINSWVASGGGDTPEGQLHALTLLAGATTGWSPSPPGHTYHRLVRRLVGP